MSDHPNTDVAFSPAVKAQQEARGSRRNYQRIEEKGGWQVEVDVNLAGFIATRDSFYLATASTGFPFRNGSSHEAPRYCNLDLR